MVRVYPAIIHNEADQYWVEFPDLEGCHTYNDSLEKTLHDASEALGLYLATFLEENRDVPKASDINEVTSDDSTAIINYIATDVDDYRRDTRTIKKTVSMPAWMAKEAEERHLSLSKILQESLKVKFDTV
ncbi:MAG: type II toxin-antitoxin system HicB family antitoxin [Firmicutes bacterium]|nr:type II toxin-antitoxin system HicB family antitoxin [Bacillota bacterium]